MEIHGKQPDRNLVQARRATLEMDRLGVDRTVSLIGRSVKLEEGRCQDGGGDRRSSRRA